MTITHANVRFTHRIVAVRGESGNHYVSRTASRSNKTQGMVIINHTKLHSNTSKYSIVNRHVVVYTVTVILLKIKYTIMSYTNSER